MWNNPNKRKRPPGETQEPMVYDEKAAFDCFSLQRFEDIKKGLGWRKQKIDVSIRLFFALDRTNFCLFAFGFQRDSRQLQHSTRVKCLTPRAL